MVGNICAKRGAAGDYLGFDIAGDEQSSSRTKENKKRRRILHLVFDAPLGMKLIAILFETDETAPGRVSACDRNVCRAGDNRAINNLRRWHTENGSREDIY